MKTAKEIVEQINTAKIPSHHYIEDILEMGSIAEVDTIDYDEHRWYVLATVVYKVGEEFFGVYGPVSLKSESMGYKDVGIDCEAFEMEAVPSVTYRAKD